MRTSFEYARDSVPAAMHSPYCGADSKHCTGCRLASRLATAIDQAVAENSGYRLPPSHELRATTCVNCGTTLMCCHTRPLEDEIRALRKIQDAAEQVVSQLIERVPLEERWHLLRLRDELRRYAGAEKNECESSSQAAATSKTTPLWKRLWQRLVSRSPKSSVAALQE